jgi:peroxiredoxin
MTSEHAPSGPGSPSADWQQLPAGLPVPEDDGAADQLPGLRLPDLAFSATDGSTVRLNGLPGPRTVIYLYPRTGVPGEPSPTGWDAIPGARGCTPESCAFRDHHAELRAAGASVYGMSSQDVGYQRAAVDRLHLPFPLISDPRLMLADAIGVPTFQVDGMTLYRRLTLVVRDGLVEHAFYPVFPPDGHAEQVLAWLRSHPPS